MPELPDLTVYLRALEPRIGGSRCEGLAIVNPFVLRSVDPPVSALVGLSVTGFRLIGKRVVIAFEGDVFVVIHLMIAGRLQWNEKPPKVNRRLMLALFTFPRGTLILTEAGTKKRASLYVVRGEAALDALARGGIEPLAISEADFGVRLRSENHTLKRSLTDPRLFCGIGNAYSDEILHRARLSPLLQTGKLKDSDISTLYRATHDVLTEWTDRLGAEVGDGWPAKVTAFRAEMAVHGKFGEPCPVCAAPVQRIRYAANETNYCARCQTGGRRLADPSMPRRR